ncbi:MAG: aromatic-ring-hydroxylating dioxygenase subunit beta [Fulvimonas sp.]|nr:aromatic-ring-hydroxylating dioxygenase subunit beta [Fulvimonas sp.]
MQTFTRPELEDFFYAEAELLDDWKLDDWLALFTKDARYEVPSTDLSRDADAATSLFYVADDAFRLSERIKRLKKKTAHAEYPRPKTRHVISNVRVLSVDGDQCKASAVFVTYRSRLGHTDTYIGIADYHLVRTGDGLRIRSKRCTLDLDSLRPHGRVSIIL